jgi:hypothetical protein
LNQKRIPKGVPTGGEFTANTHDEASSGLAWENESQTRIRAALAPIVQWYPNARTVYLTANTSDPYDNDENHYDDGETIYGYVRIDGIYDASGEMIWDQALSRRDPRLERIEDTFSETKKVSDLPIDSSSSSSRGDMNGVDLVEPFVPFDHRP